MRRVIIMSVLLIAIAQVSGSATARTVGDGHRGGATVVAGHSSDFNGDGFADLAIGVSNEDVGTIVDAGAVSVLYGSAPGLGAAGNQFWNMNSRGILGRAGSGDEFGHAVAVADFNGDGYSDLAVGAPFHDVDTIDNAGSFNVIYGSAAGLTSAASQYWNQDSANILDQAEQGDLFGASLAAGDLNGDGFADLAVGDRTEDIGAAVDAGAVNVMYGSVTGLVAAGNQFWSQDTPGILGEGAESGDVFSRGLGAGDFNGDGNDDLGVGAWTEDVGAIQDAGAASVIYGSATGLTTAGNQYWTGDSPGIGGDGAEKGDWFGRPITPGDFNGDGYSDLAIGAHKEDVGTIVDAGAASVLYGSAAGLTTGGNQFLTEADLGAAGDGVETGDHFCRAASSGDINGDGYQDLAIAISAEDVGAVNGAGAAGILYGSAAGLTDAGAQYFSQDSPNVKDIAEDSDFFGWYVKLGDFNGDGSADLTSSAAFEDMGTSADAGSVQLLYGSPGGIVTAGNQVWTQDHTNVKDLVEAGDLFGNIMD